jgi:predicted transcriptional regulator
LENKAAEVAEEVQQKKQRKKKGKITKIYELHKKGASVKKIAEKTNLSDRVVRAYIWRKENPEKYKALLNRYFSKKKQKQENEEIKEIVNNNHKTESKEKKAENA